MLEPDYCNARLLEIGVGRRFLAIQSFSRECSHFLHPSGPTVATAPASSVVEAVDLRASEVAESSSRITLQSNAVSRAILERGENKFQGTVFSANHEANDCDFRLFSTEWDKLHLCGKV
jgi:hypothetical protein